MGTPQFVQARSVLAVLVVAASLAGSVAAAPLSDASAVKTLIQRETALFNAGSWRALYALYTPSFRAKCAFGVWSAANRQFRRQTGPVTTANITVRVTGNRALANYVIKSRTGKVLARAKGDVYLKIGGRWLDEESACA
ncbi:MAG: hypothetical protein E6G08_17355 [Actinobacteria bacterium]|nr:MAG: hypothetical protein E6G08_17355 [Actinomycetota bacterium]